MAVQDFSKAFDVIPHQRLLMKLDYYGIRSNTKRWISGLLTKRLQRVCVNGQCSNWSPILSGTPHGTVLGPHLFLLHINNIHEKKVTSTTRLFADDCLLYCPINLVEDEKALQEDLDTMVQWSQSWGMQFNPSKCKTMRISRKRSPGTSSYNILGVTLEETQQTQYLGINIQNYLSWNSQMHHATGKATRVLNFLRRNFHHCSSAVKEKLYLTLVRPHLDYATASWDPFTVKNISSIKKVQRQAAPFVTSTYGRDTSVTKLLNQLDWNTLQVRREAHRLTCFYKMINNQLDIDYQSHIETKPDRRGRGHSNQFVIPAANTDIYANSYFPRTLRTWNNLQQTTIDQTSPHSFTAVVIQELSKP